MGTLRIVDAQTKREICGAELQERVNEYSRIFERSEIRSNDIVFLKIPRSLETVLVVYTCLRLRIAFTFCDPNRPSCSNHSEFRTTLIFDGKEVRRIGWNDLETEEISYVITTSGTTGIKKQVAVPVSCIQRNIRHFCSLFSLTSTDRILFSTSLHFDPSIVELFMAFHVECTIVLTPDEFRSEPHRLQRAIEEFRPTLVQLTPTVFEMLPSPDSLLSSTSPLRVLLLGGSHFPLSFINSIRSESSKTRVFNVYGVTEVSCWATVFEVEPGCSEVMIGEKIDGTVLEISEDGELLLGGPRQCYVNGVKPDKHRTGDRVELVEGGGIRIVGRMDRVVKHRGVRICLDHLAQVAHLEDHSIQSVHIIHYKNQKLVQFTVGPQFSKEKRNLKTVRIDQDTLVTVTVIHVAQLPINSSGKVDEGELKRILDDGKFEILTSLEELLEEQFRKWSMKLEKLLSKSFVEIGIKSLQAVELSSYFETGIQDTVIRDILNEKFTVGQFLEKYEGKSVSMQQKEMEKVTVIHVESKRQPRMKWAVDLKKCIDGNILVVRPSMVVCASHFGTVVAVNPENGECYWRTECGVRFEATPVLVNDQVVIGNKHHGLFFLCLKTGDLLARHEYDSTNGVRAQCAFDGKFIYCTTENGILHAIHPTTRLSMFNYQIGKGGGTSIGPVIGPCGSIYAVITAGTMAKITDLRTTWQKDFRPMFAEPSFLEDGSLVTLNVHGALRISDPVSGQIKDSLTLEEENCFCAPLIIQDSLIVATRAGHLIQLNSNPKFEVQRIFRFDLPGISFVKTPKIQELEEIQIVSKNGWLLTGHFEDYKSLETVNGYPISNREVFTSPEFFETNGRRSVLIAGRDDFLRCWNLN